MEKLIIEGGRPLSGTVEISGSKNATLPLMAASILSPSKSVIRGAPRLEDVHTMGRLLENLGAGFGLRGRRAELDTSGINGFLAPYGLVKTMRASVLVLGPLLARYGEAKVSLPGGCAIGARPINLHIAGLKKMGAKIDFEEGYVIARAKRLKGASICLDIPTVTGTENLMMAASLAKGTTVIENAAMEPEITDLASALLSMGARIKGAGEGTIEIDGVDELGPLRHTVIPDRIECGTFMTIAGITGGEVFIRGCEPRHLDSVVLKLREAGVSIDECDGGIKVRGLKRPQASDLRTMPYPGFPTDMQAQFMALMCLSNGTSVITESIFENRFMHVPELKRMGADISIQAGAATVRGVRTLKGAEVMATDLRASASLVCAALAAQGKSVIHRLYHLDRGYEKMEEKLRRLGASVKRLRQ